MDANLKLAQSAGAGIRRDDCTVPWFDVSDEGRTRLRDAEEEEGRPRQPRASFKTFLAGKTH